MLFNSINIAAIHDSNRNVDCSVERISTGARVNRAGDDAAALSISSRFTTIHNSLLQGSRNIHDGIGLVQTIDSAMEAQHGILVRIRELYVQASSDTYVAQDRELIRGELVDLRREYERISTSTTFNSIDLLSSTNSITIQTGEFGTSDYQLEIDLSDVFSNLDITTYFGNISRSVGIGFTTTSGFNQGNENLAAYNDTYFVNQVQGDAIERIDNLMGINSSRRAKMGAYQNRLEISLNNNRSYETNLMAANSNFIDVDYAQQTSELVRHQVQMSASVASMAQAKGMSSNILSLL
jgi:flagellin